MPAVAGVADGDSIQDWFKFMPIMTKIFFVGTLVTGAAVSLNLISPYDLILNWPGIRYKFHVWRLFSTFFFAGGFSFNFAMFLYMLYQNCTRYEANPFNTGAGGTSADFLWMVLVSMGALLVIAFVFDMLILSEPIMYVIMYNWSRREPDAVTGFFGFKFKAIYLPWVYIAMRLVMGGSITDPLVGIAVGHLYYFLIEVLPLTHGYNLIRTPKFCVDFVDYVTGRTNPALATQQPAYQGIGRTLGTAAAPAPAAGNNRFGGLGNILGGGGGGAANNSSNPQGGNTGLRQRGVGAAAQPSAGGQAARSWGEGRTLGSSQRDWQSHSCDNIRTKLKY